MLALPVKVIVEFLSAHIGVVVLKSDIGASITFIVCDSTEEVHPPSVTVRVTVFTPGVFQ